MVQRRLDREVLRESSRREVVVSSDEDGRKKVLGLEDLAHYESCGQVDSITAIPAEPPTPVITVSDVLAFRKHRCENTP